MPNLTPNYKLKKPIKATENADIDVLNENMDTLDTELKNVNDNVTALDNKRKLGIKILHNRTILSGSSQWEKDSITGFFKYTMNLLNVNSKTIVNINIGIEYLTSDYNTDKLIPCTRTFDNGNVELFSTEVQTKNFVCDIEIINEVI